jgi:DNA-directed RNA polymerase subunit M/transcription elongation factor TFIIS
LYILGRFIGRKIPATCNNCLSKITPKGTSVIIYHCKKCGYKYSKKISSTDHYHNDNHL